MISIFHMWMSKRQWLAALAMQGMMADPEWYDNYTKREMAERAYAMADAMLTAEKTSTSNSRAKGK